ncbi:MAG: LysR family transcriptional regulator [Alphaproteobacteria bacterium]|nr:LysR family transcriptional regulator [Alphaproteobacteria bacterium]
MDTEVARTFLLINETGSFKEAAERLNVTQSTVSARIKLLEETLGRSVFNRSKAGVHTTQAGVQFLRNAEVMVRTWEQARQEVALPQGLRGLIRVGGQFTLWEHFVLKLIPILQKSAPDTAVRAEVGQPDRLSQRLLDGMIDVAVMYAPQNRSRLVVETLLTDKLIYVSTDPKVKPGQDPGYVMIDWGPEFFVDYAAAFPGMDAPLVSVNHGPLAMRYILENGGSAYFPVRMARPYLRRGRMYRVDAPEFSRPIHMAYMSGAADTEGFKYAVQGLREIAGRLGGR